MPRSKPPRTLFDQTRDDHLRREAPLAARMRPRSLEELVGQDHLVGPGRVLRRSIESDRLPSMILWGPPGCGKTTLARVIAQTTQCHFEPVSAVTAGVADLRRIVQEAADRLGETGQRTILFIDEIHRFNKAQQDVILPHVEEGTITLIGATTENPSFEVIGPLLSRSRVYTLKQLTPDEVGLIVDRALADSERGLGMVGVELAPEARDYLVAMAGGDARSALNTLELAAAAVASDRGHRPPRSETGGAGGSPVSGGAGGPVASEAASSARPETGGLPASRGPLLITLPVLEDALQHRGYQYDKAGDAHYDTISAFIKSLRGSDPDAALYWLARMIEAGEDPLFIVRRMVILAAEDVGLADPQALVVATACQQAVHFIGMPEGFLPMAECTVYLATAPKSNSAYAAYQKALEDVRRTGQPPVPLHLRNAPTGLMRAQGYSAGYRYSHDFNEHYVEQQYLPSELEGHRYYQPGGLGYEAKVSEWLEHLRTRPPNEHPTGGQAGD